MFVIMDVYDYEKLSCNGCKKIIQGEVAYLEVPCDEEHRVQERASVVNSFCKKCAFEEEE